MLTSVNFKKVNNLGQIVGLTILTLGYCLFVISSFNYQSEWWFPYLIGGRILAIVIAIILIIVLGRSKKEIHLDSFYYIFCLGLQSLHGILEGSKSYDFYSYTGIFFIISALSTSTTFKRWLSLFFPFQLLFLVLPLFFKDQIYFKSIGSFIDSFSLPISSLVIGLVIIWINIEKYEIYLQNLKLKDELAKKHEEISKQLAHDIRSPLASLNVVVGNLKSIPEEYRLIIKNSVTRINDIANTLLNNTENPHQNKNQLKLLFDIVDSIVSEKRVQFRDRIGVEIETEFTNSYGLFSEVDSVELKRVLSNLINNSVEALNNNKGRIKVNLKSEENFSIITLSDNGKGIPKEILVKLGKKNLTFDKIHGSGLGIYHARKVIDSFGGEISFNSIEDVGTEVIIKIPKSLAPNWYIDKIRISSAHKIVILDDDSSIHQIWEKRFESGSGVVLIKFTSGIEFKTYVHSLSSEEKSKNLYLIDFELLNQEVTGLDLINDLNIGPESILVTSHYEDEQISHLQQRIIPKSMISYVPIDVTDSQFKYSIILIDDDRLIRTSWQIEARNKKINFISFDSYLSFEENLSKLNRDATVYIDSSLGKNAQGNEEKGEDCISKVLSFGFEKIYLSTGHEASQFTHIKGLSGIVGKDPSFLL